MSFNHSYASLFFNFLMMFLYFISIIIVDSLSFTTSYKAFAAYNILIKFNRIMSLA